MGLDTEGNTDLDCNLYIFLTSSVVQHTERNEYYIIIIHGMTLKISTSTTKTSSKTKKSKHIRIRGA